MTLLPNPGWNGNTSFPFRPFYHSCNTTATGYCSWQQSRWWRATIDINSKLELANRSHQTYYYQTTSSCPLSAVYLTTMTWNNGTRVSVSLISHHRTLVSALRRCFRAIGPISDDLGRDVDTLCPETTRCLPSQLSRGFKDETSYIEVAILVCRATAGIAETSSPLWKAKRAGCNIHLAWSRDRVNHLRRETRSVSLFVGSSLALLVILVPESCFVVYQRVLRIIAMFLGFVTPRMFTEPWRGNPDPPSEFRTCFGVYRAEARCSKGYGEIRRILLGPIRRVNTFTTLDIKQRLSTFAEYLYHIRPCVIIFRDWTWKEEFISKSLEIRAIATGNSKICLPFDRTVCTTNDNIRNIILG